MNFVNCAFVLLAGLVPLTLGAAWFTALDTENHPCKPENLKRTNRYICDGEGNVICQAGWREPENREPEFNLNPCLEPICEHNGIGCVHGECRAPEYCACEVGWEGTSCNKCVRLPGCEHGTCGSAFECNCDPGWEGAYCNIAECNGCQNGHCVEPNECVCMDGWTGSNCTECQKMPGCLHGHCGAHPHTCECNDGWEGHLCDKASCNPSCVHGFCYHPPGNVPNFCVCDNGWRGDGCEHCSPYWNCPNQEYNACNLPNECFCFQNEADSEGLCNNTILLQHESHHSLGPKMKHL